MASPFSLGQNMGWQGNPLYDALSSRRNALVGLGAGLASGNDWGEGIGRGLELAGQGAVRDDAYALMQEEQAKEAEVLNKTTEWLRANGQTQWLAAVESGAVDPGTAFNAILTAQTKPERGVVINGQLVDPSNGAILGDYRDAATGSTEYGLTPIWGQFPDGTFGYGVQGKDGTFKRVDTGDLNPLDPRTLAGERAYGTQVGNAQGAAVAGAQSDISNALTAIDLLDQIESSPELPWATGRGAAMGLNNPIINPQRFGFQNLVDQAKSGAFLTAIQDMKGLGALSNTEGQVATAAITRMNTALSETDFKKALSDYRAVIERALERAEGRVGMQPNVNTPRPQQNSGTTSSGVPWSISGQ